VLQVDAVPEAARLMLEEYEVVLAQTYVPTAFDWRIAVLDRIPLFASRQHLGEDAWQPASGGACSGAERKRGRCYTNEAVSLEDVPTRVLEAALAAAVPIGDGLYGVRVKEVGAAPYVTDLHDNPTIDAGIDDHVEGVRIYERIMQFLRARVASRRGGG
jgi:glutathione synthase/RimK-type ligase-like ATP-grasp enzyme